MDVVPVTVTEGWMGRELCRRTWLVGHNGSLRNGIPSDFRREPSPEGRGGKMLEETHPDYSFLFLHIEHIVSREPLFVRYRTVLCASAYGFYRIYSRASESRVDAPFPRAVQ